MAAEDHRIGFFALDNLDVVVSCHSFQAVGMSHSEHGATMDYLRGHARKLPFCIVVDGS